MPRMSTWQAIGLAALFAVFCAGCPQQGGPEPVEPAGQQPAQPQQPATDLRSVPGGDSATSQPVKQREPEPPPPPPTVPEVHMTEALRATCLVFVGDKMPDAELADLEGTPKSVAELRGKKLTVILFWSRGDSLFAQMAATAALEDLQKDVAEPYGDKGVNVLAVNVKDPVDAARKNVEEAKATFPNLSDPEGKFFGQVATQELPRVYLLDSEGKIIWFDIEVSRSTRRNLLQAIQVELGEI